MAKFKIQNKEELEMNNANDVRERMREDGREKIDEMQNEYKESNFKFENCKFNLPQCNVSIGCYSAYMMEAGDERMAALNLNNDFSDHLPPMAILFGMLEPNAGFFVIENTTTGEIVAYALVYTTTSNNGYEFFVFDGLRLSIRVDYQDIIPVIGLWLKKCDYENVIMGNHKNQLTNNDNDLKKIYYNVDVPLSVDYLNVLLSNPYNNNAYIELLNLWGYESFEDMLQAIVNNDQKIFGWFECVDRYDITYNRCVFYYTDTSRAAGSSVLKVNGIVEPFFEDGIEI